MTTSFTTRSTGVLLYYDYPPMTACTNMANYHQMLKLQECVGKVGAQSHPLQCPYGTMCVKCTVEGGSSRILLIECRIAHKAHNF
jgi:hypothetical protein